MSTNLRKSLLQETIKWATMEKTVSNLENKLFLSAISRNLPVSGYWRHSRTYCRIFFRSIVLRYMRYYCGMSEQCTLNKVPLTAVFWKYHWPPLVYYLAPFPRFPGFAICEQSKLKMRLSTLDNLVHTSDKMYSPSLLCIKPTWNKATVIYSQFLSQDILDTDQSVNYYTFAQLCQSVTYYVLYYVLLIVCCSGKWVSYCSCSNYKVSLKNNYKLQMFVPKDLRLSDYQGSLV